MRHRLLAESDGRRTFAVTLQIGEEAVGALTELARELRLGASQITGIGGFQRARLGYFDAETVRLEPIENPFRANVLPMCPV